MGTVFVDSRTGSIELQPALRKLGIDAQEAILDSADFMFAGNGPDGEVQIGIERKTLSDLVTSLRDGRLPNFQMEKLRRTYDVMWLLVEGEIATDRLGRLYGHIGRRKRQALPGSMTEDVLVKSLLTLELQGGFRIVRTMTPKQSASWIASCARWWSDKQWDEHSTLSTPYQRTMVPVSLFCDRAMKLPGVGLAVAKSLEVACQGSENKLCRMSLSELSDIPVSMRGGTKRLGFLKAEAILQAARKLSEGY